MILQGTVACVVSVPVRAERNTGPREGVFTFRTRGKWSTPPPLSFLLSPHFPHFLNGKTPSRGPIFRSARTGTLATQAKGTVARIA